MNISEPAARSAPFVPLIRLYQDWLREQRGLEFVDYHALWQWSVTDLEAFWQSIWDWADLQSPTPHRAVLAGNVMPGAQWFVGAQVNYARQVLRHADAAHAAGQPALIAEDERGRVRELSWPELRRQVSALALHLQHVGVQPGDRVAAYLPNIPETIVAFLACASVGAVWSVCAPDMGSHAVLDRFRQIEPKVLIAVDGVTWAGRALERSDTVAQLRAELPSVQHVLAVRYLHDDKTIADSADWANVTARNDAETAAFEPRWLPFDHPLWIVYSSGTTGLPKPIVHSHGGILVVSMTTGLHSDVGCSYAPNNFGERFCWYSSTGWIMWNIQVGGLLTGTTCVIFDGSPGGPRDAPDWGTLWRFAARHGVTFLGSGAAFYAGCAKAGVDLAQCGDLSRIRAIGTTGSPLSPEVQQWGTEQFRRIARTPAQEDIWWFNVSGGTDFAGGFIAGTPELPQQPGVMQCRMLGAAVEAWDEAGHSVKGQVGELVCTQPIPSMPLSFWNDPGRARYLASYFEMYPPGHGRKPGGGDLGPEAGSVWRHGDWLRIGDEHGEGEWCVIYGRSDATINRQGLRMGTSEIYSAVEALPEVLDSLVVDLEYLGRESWMPLFVVLRPGHALDEALTARINDAIRRSLSPRFVPNEIFQVAEIPRTLSGKKQELPIKKLLLGQAIDKVVNREAMANPGSLAWFVEFAARRASG
ncbi:acetoacetate--CoA ligase [Comamonas sp. NLF-1-9]|uniref:acetoacetate--CoA ligase n=1 Tax=Comamonas sp. NLF-1-9 TaxID=2853163 RepID=UPI001C44BE35|nr:acetoacetate--CoA ligase [Comamonas sp. NLF-1-9]QXL83914.1 acetoacetate--CoA ligase [Comamonas sp. NLF-1-9]